MSQDVTLSIASKCIKSCKALPAFDLSKTFHLYSAIFMHCENLISIIFPQNPNYTKINRKFFASCFNLQKVILSSFITDIGNKCFYQCSSLTNIGLPLSLKVINPFAFACCKGLKTINIPPLIIDKENLKGYIFIKCSSLEYVHLNPQTTHIPAGLFDQCKKLRNFIFPLSVRSLGQYSFRKCYGLVNILLPDNLNDIGEGAFLQCTSLIFLKMPANMTDFDHIGDDLCYGCKNLLIVIWPSLRSIFPLNAFYGCPLVKVF
jgi:hypothetical protein